MTNIRTKTLFFNQGKFTNLEEDPIQPMDWESVCGGHDTKAEAIQCGKDMHKAILDGQMPAFRGFDKTEIAQRIVKVTITEEVVDPAYILTPHNLSL